jgi:chromosome segregation ATPase
MIDIEDLLAELETIKANQKALAEKEALCKAEIMEAMQEDGLEKEESPHGTVRIQRRYEKDYGPEIRTMEQELKEAKKLKDDLGDYQLLGFKESLVYTPTAW